MKRAATQSRRDFITKSCAAAGAALAMPYIIPSSALGKDGVVAPSERITLGAIGIGSRGTHVLRAMLQQPDVRCLAVCDLKTVRLKAAKAAADNTNGNFAAVSY